MVFEIQFKTIENGIEKLNNGYITIVDSAGRESPIDILNTYIDTSNTTIQSIMSPPPIGGEKKIESLLKKEYQGIYSAKDISDILNEGFYINETLNHLIYYFNLKNGITKKVIKQKKDDRMNVMYSVDNYFVSPSSELKGDINTSNNSLMIPILQFLDNLNKSEKTEKVESWMPSKFITLACVRQELVYCDSTMESIMFADNIKSS